MMGFYQGERERFSELLQIELLSLGIAEGIPSPDSKVDQLLSYAEFLHRCSHKTGLISKSTASGIVRDHIFDLLYAAPHLVQWNRYIDIGSGLGLPGLILAILFPERHCVLIEPRRKPADLLLHITHQLSLSNVTIYNARAEDLAFADLVKDPTVQTLALSRAFSPLGEFFKVCKALLPSPTPICFFGAHHCRLLDDPLVVDFRVRRVVGYYSEKADRTLYFFLPKQGDLEG